MKSPRQARIFVLAALAAGSTASCVSGPWPGRPPPFTGQVPAAIDYRGADSEILAQLRKADGASRYPTKYFWREAPDWRPRRSAAGIITGRYTDNTPIVRIHRFDGSADKWPDLCGIKIIGIEQAALDARASQFAPARSVKYSASGTVDCAVYDAAP